MSYIGKIARIFLKLLFFISMHRGHISSEQKGEWNSRGPYSFCSAILEAVEIEEVKARRKFLDNNENTMYYSGTCSRIFMSMIYTFYLYMSLKPLIQVLLSTDHFLCVLQIG
jgi:hypothetical protein